MIHIVEAGPVRRIFMTRAAKRNAIDTAMAQGLMDALRDAESDAAVAAIVLAAEGDVFSAGADLAERKALAADSEARAARWALGEALLMASGEIGKPVVAAVQGAALGAGAALALCCDMMVMATAATLAFPETRHGMLPSLMAPVLRARLPAATVFRLLATGTPVSAEEAERLGLAAAVVAPAGLIGAADALALSAATLPVPQMRALKRLCAPQGLAAGFAGARAIVQEIA